MKPIAAGCTLPCAFLQAMAASGASGAHARVFLPAVLNLLSSFPGAVSAFEGAWRSLPLRTYLPWVSQMLSLLGQPEGGALVPVLEALAAR